MGKGKTVEEFETSLESRRRRSKTEDFGLPPEIEEIRRQEELNRTEAARRSDTEAGYLSRRERDPMKRDFR